MALNQETIKNLSTLARLRLPAEREEKILSDLESILDWVLHSQIDLHKAQ